jgi:hypothetical protein
MVPEGEPRPYGAEFEEPTAIVASPIAIHVVLHDGHTRRTSVRTIGSLGL